MKKAGIFVFIFLFGFLNGYTQDCYWQQRVKYIMDVDVDAATNIMKGTQQIQYFNNSPDDLNKVFFHLYWNAFQPGSGMDVRSRELGKIKIGERPDWDSRVRDRISKLSPSEIGYQKIKSIRMNGVQQKTALHGTILEVLLSQPIKAGSNVSFEVVFEAQVPAQVRRSGRDNAEGIRYSMSQWYPKMCEYDEQGWHPAQYIAREFYGVWGDFDVTIHIDKDYKLGATGVLVNAAEIGWGYDRPGTPLKEITTPKRTWHFVGKNVHDFVWAADPEYKHLVRNQNGVTLNVIYQEGDAVADNNWEKVAEAAVTVLPFIEKNFGKYPYPQYSFIQGGDGGMEYPMATLLKGPSLGTVFHEWMHSWYQMILGTNENKHPWMDEGFTSWAEGEVNAYYRQEMGMAPPEKQPLPMHHAGAYRNYYFLMKTDLAEPMTTFSDHYNTNFAYSINAYSKGEIFLEQLGYIVGDAVRDKIMLKYYDNWKFKHPDPFDFIRVSERVSGLQLDWYKEYWINTIKTIDYSIDSLWEEDGKTNIRIRRKGELPMPIDLKLTFKDSTSQIHYVPLNLMLGNKPHEQEEEGERIVHEEWAWTHPAYNVVVDRRLVDLVSVEIDPTKRMADVDLQNNALHLNW